MTSISAQGTPKRGAKMAVNLNELLNFTLPPRESRPLTFPRRSRRAGTHVWNKERFVNAQYRFVMDPTGDYTVHFADPDIFFQWQDVLQVIIPRNSAVAAAASNIHNEGHISCPICLSPPVAPRMTKCGHVFCFHCILHYLNTSDNKWARCPICFDSVNERQLKSVKWFDGAPPDFHLNTSVEEIPRAGATMHFRLMQRPQITTLALPRSSTWPSDLLPPHQAPFHFLPDVFTHAKFMLATPDYLIGDLTQDLNELAAERRLLLEMKDDLGISFLDGAEHKVQLQISKASALQNALFEEKVEKAHKDLQDIINRHMNKHVNQHQRTDTLGSENVPEEFLSLNSVTPKPRAGPTRNGPKQRRNVNPPPPSTSTYYYYQAASGLPIFLHPLDIKILLAHFHSYSSFPDTIAVRVENFSEGSVNDDLRKRCKYLAHMPESADVVFIEADLEGVVGKEGLKNFEGALKLRMARRREKDRKDERAKARAEGKQKERIVVSSWDYVPPAQFVAVDSEDEFVPLPVRDGLSPKPPAPVTSGAWGSRSFASTLSSPSQGRGNRTTRAEDQQDDWDVDEAWHELEERSVNDKKKRGNKLVILGGSGRRR